MRRLNILQVFRDLSSRQKDAASLCALYHSSLEMLEADGSSVMTQSCTVKGYVNKEPSQSWCDLTHGKDALCSRLSPSDSHTPWWLKPRGCFRWASPCESFTEATMNSSACQQLYELQSLFDTRMPSELDTVKQESQGLNFSLYSQSLQWKQPACRTERSAVRLHWAQTTETRNGRGQKHVDTCHPFRLVSSKETTVFLHLCLWVCPRSALLEMNQSCVPDRTLPSVCFNAVRSLCGALVSTG